MLGFIFLQQQTGENFAALCCQGEGLLSGRKWEDKMAGRITDALRVCLMGSLRGPQGQGAMSSSDRTSHSNLCPCCPPSPSHQGKFYKKQNPPPWNFTGLHSLRQWPLKLATHQSHLGRTLPQMLGIRILWSRHRKEICIYISLFKSSSFVDSEK